jgi:zinc transporter ZupT
MKSLKPLLQGAGLFGLFAGASVTRAAELNTSELTSFVESILGLIDSVVIPVIFAVAFLVFIWGVYRYFIAGAAQEEKRDEGKKFVLWGIIGFVVMISVWGIVNLLVTTLGFNSETRPCLPTISGECREAGSTTP